MPGGADMHSRARVITGLILVCCMLIQRICFPQKRFCRTAEHMQRHNR